MESQLVMGEFLPRTLPYWDGLKKYTLTHCSLLAVIDSCCLTHSLWLAFPIKLVSSALALMSAEAFSV